MTKPHEPTPRHPLGPELDFLQRLWQLNHALESLSSRMERRLGVTAKQRLILRCVGRYPGITAGHLARTLHVDPGTVSAGLRRLESKDLLQRRRDPLDGRRTTLELTANGKAMDRPSEGTVEHAVERLLASTPPRQLSAMTTVLDQLTDLLGQELLDELPRSRRTHV